MKNYVQLFPFAILSDPPPPTVLAYGFLFSSEERSTYFNDNPLPANQIYYAGAPMYFLLNKWNVQIYIQNYPWPINSDGTFPASPQQYVFTSKEAKEWGGDLVGVWQYDDADPRSQLAHVAAAETRVTKLKKADFSGAQTLLDALSALPTLAAELTKIGKLREAGIVIYAYNQVIKGYWSITEAFAYLIKAGIVGTHG
jgi:hypothetical protein